MTDGSETALRRARFDNWFRGAEDPWNYTSHYESRKYRQTLSLVPTPPAERALEIGCAEGHFTAQLAPKVKCLTALDISPVAIERAKRRCASCANVRFAELDVFAAPLEGTFDLIVCSEVLYLVPDLPTIERAVEKIARALAPGGLLLTAHAHVVGDGETTAAFNWDGMAAGAAGIERALLATGLLRLDDEIRTDLYRVQRYARATPGEPGPPRPKPRIEPMGVLHPELSATVVWERVDPTSPAALTVLAYHRISSEGPPALDQYRLDPVTFDQQLRLLWESGYRTVSLDQWRRFIAGHGSLPERPLLLTFDDGYLDFVTNAWPTLQRYGYGALVSLVTDCVGGKNAWDAEFGPPIPLMDWQAVSDLHRQGVEFAAHTATHCRLTSLDPVEATREIWASKVRLEEQLGSEVAAFVYPHGDRNPQVASLVRGCGFACALDGRFGVVSPGEDMFDLPRIEVRVDTSPATLLATISQAQADLQAAQPSEDAGLADRYPRMRRMARHLPDRPRRALAAIARRALNRR